MSIATRCRLALLGLVTASLAACSGGAGSGSEAGSGAASPGAAAGDGSRITSDVTWSDGMRLTSSVVIARGATVTIAPGALIACDDGITITVEGTLTSAVGGAVAKLAGEAWTGIVVAEGGTLALDGVDIESTRAAIEVQAKAASARYDRGTIRASKAPFVVDAGGALTTTRATVYAPLGTSRVQGSFTASHLDYDANGWDGITTGSDDAELSIEDSTLHGIDGNTDMIASYTGAKRIHVAYTTIEHVHCAFHMERVATLDVSFVTAQTDAYGFMMYGSLSEGTRSITSSNFASNLEWGIHEEETSINGAVSVTRCYFGGNGLGDVYTHAASAIHVSGNAAAPIAAARPRS